MDTSYMTIGRIKRTSVGPLLNLTITEFTNLEIDYRPCGDKDRQLSQLEQDYRHFEYRARRTGKQGEVEHAFVHYKALIECGYIEPLPDTLPPEV